MLRVKILPKDGGSVPKTQITEMLRGLNQKLQPYKAAVMPHLKNGKPGYHLDHSGQATVYIKGVRVLPLEAKKVIETEGFTVLV